MHRSSTPRPRRERSGFTLVELMIVVAILGILAAIAIPGFSRYIRRAKTSEATTMLNAMFKSAAVYYLGEHAAPGINGRVFRYCAIENANAGIEPRDDKSTWPEDDGNFGALDFQVADYVYYNYRITSAMSADSRCYFSEEAPEIYTFEANGDLDGNGVLSTFRLAVGSDDQNELYHARGFQVIDELE